MKNGIFKPSQAKALIWRGVRNEPEMVEVLMIIKTQTMEGSSDVFPRKKEG